MVQGTISGLASTSKKVSLLLYLKETHVIESLAVSDFYIILFDAIISGKNPAAGDYFLEHEEVRMFDLCAAIGKALFKHGKVSTAEPVALNEAELAMYSMVCIRSVLMTVEV